MIVFAIDIDGVARPDLKPNDYKVDNSCVHRINQALRHFNAKVIITSNWRLAFDVSFFNKLFEGRVIAMTEDPDDSGPENRWNEIRTALGDLPKPLGLVILDDRPDLFPSNLPYLHLCDPSAGFSESDLHYFIGGYQPNLYPNHQPHRDTVMSDEATNNDSDLDEMVPVQISLSRRDLNRLTHATVQGDYEGAVRWACYDSLKQARHLRDFVEEAPFVVEPLDEPDMDDNA